MSPWRSSTRARRPFSRFARATESMALRCVETHRPLRARPRAAPACGPVCRLPRSTSARSGSSPSACRIAASETTSAGACILAKPVPVPAPSRGEIGLRRLGARRAHGGEPLAVRPTAGYWRRRRRARRGAGAAASRRRPRSARRKNAHAPSRWRSTRPASTRSFRWREMRGCDWPEDVGEIRDRELPPGPAATGCARRVLLPRGAERGRGRRAASASDRAHLRLTQNEDYG